MKTGVKYLHSRALQYDVGIYFEANGHGTTVFGKTFKEKIAEASLTARLLIGDRYFSDSYLLTTFIYNLSFKDLRRFTYFSDNQLILMGSPHGD